MKIYEGRYNAAIRILQLQPEETSSTEIRNMIRKGKDVSRLLPAKLVKYIDENGLYR